MTRWRPYFAYGRHQFRIGVRRWVEVPAYDCPQHAVCGRTHRAFTRPEVRFIALEWQL